MNDNNIKLNALLNKLELEYVSYNEVLIALSGGVDSCLAAFLGRKFLGKEKTIAVISNSDSLKEKDFEIAKKFCETHDITYKVIFTKELENPNYISNPTDRCYFCKTELYTEINKLVSDEYINYVIVNGNNYTDLGDYRPGLEAASEHSTRSPFIACNINKQNIRDLAFHFNLEVWDKPASPCLSSRFPYGESITKEKLKRVEKAESLLNDFGFDEIRVRSYGDLAKIEVPTEQIPALLQKFSEIENHIIQFGFTKCEVDNEGFISGKMNRILE